MKKKGGRGFLRFSSLPTMLVLVSGSYLALVLLLVAIPVSWSAELAKDQARVRGSYLAEDIVLRALEGGLLRRGGTMTLPEGGLSSSPGRTAEVLWLPRRNRSSVLCILGGKGGHQQYLADFVRGSLHRPYSFALGEGDPSESLDHFYVRGLRRRLEGPRKGAAGSTPGERLSSLFPEPWGEGVDLVLGEDGEGQGLRACPDFPIQFLGTSTDQEDYFLGSEGMGGDLCLTLGGPQTSVIRVPGNLWLGMPGRETSISTTADSLVFLVDGNLYVQGQVRPSRRGLKLYFLVGRPGARSFRDLNRNGRRDAGEPALPAGGSKRGMETSEGRGTAWFGFGDQDCSLEATVVARHDLVPAGGRVELRGAFLAGGRLLAGGRKGLLTIHGPEPGDLPLRPRRGLPLVPGSEGRFWILSIRRIGED